MVRMAAGAATRLRPCKGEARAPDNRQEGKALRHHLESRRQQRVPRYRFRRHPDAYLAVLETQLLQLILPP